MTITLPLKTAQQNYQKQKLNVGITKVEKPLHIATYVQDTLSYPTFVFTLCPKEMVLPDLPYGIVSLGNGILVSSKQVPRIWRPELNAYYAGPRFADRNLKPIGYMTYYNMQAGNSSLAFSDFYYPRCFLGKGIARKLPYFMEAIAIVHLKRMGFTDVSSGCTSQKRTEQLEAVELPTGTDIPIGKWLKSMGLGIRKTLHGDFDKKE